MRVVLFCGGLGMRLRPYSEVIPKPMVTVGSRPILWHLMEYYAHFGHREFILCLGYRGEVIKRYFLDHDDLKGWSITFADTGLETTVGERLKAVERYLDDAPTFLANYADALTDLELPTYLQEFEQRGKIAAFVSVRPSHSFHVVSSDAGGLVDGIRSATDVDLWVNGGFFAFRREIFDYIGKGEELVEEPFRRLIAQGELITHRHIGFWACMDTLKDKQRFDELGARADAPWEVWRQHAAEPRGGGRRDGSRP